MQTNVKVLGGLEITVEFTACGAETCPKCQGVTGYETDPNDWHDCDLCDATGKVRSK